MLRHLAGLQLFQRKQVFGPVPVVVLGGLTPDPAVHLALRQAFPLIVITIWLHYKLGVSSTQYAPNWTEMDGHQMIHGPMSKGQKLDFEFDRFITENPHVYEKFRMRPSRPRPRLRALGPSRWEVTWELAVDTNVSVTQPKLNNNHQPYGPQAGGRRPGGQGSLRCGA